MKLVYAVAGIWIAAIACDKQLDESRLKDTLPYLIGDAEPSLGNGFNSLTQVLKNSTQCVNGAVENLKSSRIETDMTRNISYQSIMNEYSGEVKGTPRLVFANIDSSNGFFRSLTSGEYNHSLIYSSKIIAGGSKLSNVSLKDELKTSELFDLLGKCGDHYVSQINMGARLTIAVNFVFSSSLDRDKKQSINKISGSWLKVQGDLTQKIEELNLEGVMEVHVNQDGGNLTSTKLESIACPLNTKEDLVPCLDHVTELVRYADSEFKTSAQANPTVLSYVTSPLAEISHFENLPELPLQVMEQRRQLKEDLDRYISLKSSLQSRMDGGYQFDSFLRRIENKISLIKEVAQSCYDYRIGPEHLSWDDCNSAYSQYRDDFSPEDMIQLKQVNADQILPTYILNNYQKPIVIELEVSDQDLWSFNSLNTTNYRGSSVKCGSQCPAPQEARGRLLILRKGVFDPVESSMNFALKPGEAAFFTMNDDLNSYLDNRSSVSLFWTCLNCRKEDPQYPYEVLTVDASKELGTVFSSLGDHKYILDASGIWSSGKPWLPGFGETWSGPLGSMKSCDQCPFEQSNLGVMIWGNDFRGYYGYEGQREISLRRGEDLRFKMNDAVGQYGNNKGFVKVLLTCTSCERETDGQGSR